MTVLFAPVTRYIVVASPPRPSRLAPTTCDGLGTN
jgi:hypothetical protein